MHLVFATSLVPDGAPQTGYEIANAAIIGALRRAGARVTVLGFLWPGKRPADPDNTIVLGEVDVRTDSASAAQKGRWLARALVTGLTFSSVKLAVLPLAAVRAALGRAGPFDAFVANAVPFAGAFPRLFDDKPFIYVAHNVEHVSARENAAAASGLQRLLFRREARLLEALEAELCRRARFVLTLAKEDRAPLGVADDARSAALSLVTRQAAPLPAPRRIVCDAALIGTWTWQPNRIGLDWFMGEVMPRLPSDFRVRVAGSLPAGYAPPLPNVELAGRVPDATEFVRGAAVVPLVSRAGTGVQLKTIETFELGLPSVATSHSLRGISYVPANCTVSDDPADFAAALLAARNGGHDLDGGAFHRAQRAALDEAVRKALARFAFQREYAFA